MRLLLRMQHWIAGWIWIGIILLFLLSMPLALATTPVTGGVRMTAQGKFFPLTQHGALVHQGKLWVLGGLDRYDIWNSNDAVNWNLVINKPDFYKSYVGFRQPLGYVLHNGRIFMMRQPWTSEGSGLGFDVWSSLDGVQWIKEADAASLPMRERSAFVSFSGKLWVIAGRAPNGFGRDDVWSSSDGRGWTREVEHAPFGERYGHTALVFNGQLWVIGGFCTSGQNYDVWRSSDGINWTQTALSAFPNRMDHACVAFDNKLWVIGGYVGSKVLNDLWWSADGTSWQKAAAPPFKPRFNHRAVAYGGKLYVIGGTQSLDIYSPGHTNEIWVTTDGQNWRLADASTQLPVRSQHGAVAFQGKVWAIGGENPVDKQLDDIWWSTDGSEWTLALAQAPFGKRSGLACGVLNGSIYVIGGYNGSALLKDVWRSPDGVNWSQLTATPPFPARRGHACLAFGGKLWIIGGFTGYGMSNEVWSSPDGLNWTRAASGKFPARSWCAATVQGGRMWVIGGLAGAGDGASAPALGDAWWSLDGATWTAAPIGAAGFPACGRMSAATLNGEMLLVGGRAASTTATLNVWRADQGTTWTLVPQQTTLPQRENHVAVVLNDKLWLVGGDLIEPGSNWSAAAIGDCRISADAASWTNPISSLPLPASPAIRGLICNRRIWRFGSIYPSAYGSVWSSGDGQHWRLETQAPPFGQLYNNYCTALNGRLWALGGWKKAGGSTEYATEVWSSADGTSWTRVSAAAPFEHRSGAQFLGFQDKLWLIGGEQYNANDEYVPLNEIWSSADGTSWTRINSINYPARFSRRCVVFDGRIWLTGGLDNLISARFQSDVWWTTDCVTWHQATSRALPDVDNWAEFFVYDNDLWLMGGGTFWRSHDGATWRNMGGITALLRGYYSGLEFGGKLWLLGDNGDSWTCEELPNAARAWTLYDR